MDILFDRVSCRNYKNDDIPQQDLDYILHAGMSAPTAYNAREWSFLVIKDKETHKKIMDIHEGYGSVWCGVATNIERQEGIAKLFNLPHNIIPFSLIVIGKSNEDKKIKQRWDETKIKYEKF